MYSRMGCCVRQVVVLGQRLVENALRHVGGVRRATHERGTPDQPIMETKDGPSA
jgi:hypothetical protein